MSGSWTLVTASEISFNQIFTKKQSYKEALWSASRHGWELIMWRDMKDPVKLSAEKTTSAVKNNIKGFLTLTAPPFIHKASFA